MNLSKRDQKLIIILVSIVIFIGAYIGVYSNFNKKTEAVESEIAALKPRLQELQSYSDNMNQYKQGIADSRVKMAEALAQYPNAVRPEDQIMYAVDMESEVGLKISTATFSEPEYILGLRGITEKEGGGYAVAPLTAYRSTMAFACTLSYQELKNAVDYINFTKTCTRLNNVSVSYDSETGELAGNMTIDKYYIAGLDPEYHETYVPPMSLGTDNVFGTIIGAAPAP